MSGRLIGQFADNLATLLTAPVSAPAAAPADSALDVWTLVPPPVRVGLRVVLPALLLVSLGWLLGRRR